MIPQKTRIPRSGFRERGYRAITTKLFSLKVRQNPSGKNRIAVVVGKAVDKRASQRNFWKRQGKVQLLRVPAMGKDFVLTLFPGVNKLKKADFKKEVAKVLEKVVDDKN